LPLLIHGEKKNEERDEKENEGKSTRRGTW
jgi:hypothetical protein